MNNKKVIISLFSLSFVFIITGVLAYFYNNSSIQNRFVSGTYKTVTTEEFTSPTNWLPGDVTPKTITTKNEGTVPVRVRVKLEESWEEVGKSDSTIPNSYCLEITSTGCNNHVQAAVINYDNFDDWVYSSYDDYAYYVHELGVGEETSSLIKSVTFNSQVGTAPLCNDDGEYVSCDSFYTNFVQPNFKGATYNLNFTIETVQADKYDEVWGYAPVMNDYVGDNPCTYNGELVSGAEYTNGQYTYRYRQIYFIDVNTEEWIYNSDLGWGVVLTNPESTAAVNTTLCSSINNKPIVSTSGMFANSKTTSIDMSSFDTSNVRYMYGMFYNSVISSVDMASLDTSKVKSMGMMFSKTNISSLNFSHNDISSLTDLYCMFEYSTINTLDLSTLEYRNNMNLYGIFRNANIDKIIVKDQAMADLGHMGYPCTNYYIGEELVYSKDNESCNSAN